MNRYQEAGVDVNAGYELVDRIKAAVSSTDRPGVVGGIGSFGGMFDLGELHMKHPVLVSGTDGVGTKLLIAQRLGKHDTIGIDVVAMCVNDVLAQGAEPLFFLDYIATGHNDPQKMAEIVSGVAAGCRDAGVALIGGETAEMPDMYSQEEYDLAGTVTGVAEKDQLLTTELPQAGDVLLGLPSSGIHSNGFSLVRQILFKDHDIRLNNQPSVLQGMTVGEAILKPTRIYVRQVLPLIRQKLIKGVSHITGGGLIENVPRMIGDQLQAVIVHRSWPSLPVFDYLQQLGQLPLADCFQTFNMGIGLVLAVDPAKVDLVQEKLTGAGEKSYRIGQLRHRPENAAKIEIK
ncbi:MAG: phosphoribosylformylglycinamidine cyclo-ligase [Limosilactobacillus sp.]|jgi:phosphoribosylformylglycinamidine cyclo-ligase|uniref:phosphoribosylformylglycinamidine cyclo-ligase n=1 Tax=Limosilactobacillus sp. TaxID=2773925 RepID=UPI0025BA2E2A|nr:phosphoribosylformylglycinamidine cyclo-ligase [Limosilactobacillus sp.]MCI1974892.1 phosphoribosylformylglycinamidine cyclo-ligase [Limosilactobacillus sp.]MCI2030827.1 phosphoribosylformylglycinamidine cyclo-ligase [Limosilactobacillus sp.]